MHRKNLEMPGFRTRRERLYHRYAVLVAAATLLLIFAVGLVTSTGSGLAVPDWPLSFGQLFPPMEGGVLFEHGHRMVAAFVGLLTVVLAVWAWVLGVRPAIRWLATAAVFLVVIQGVLGGITVLYRLPFWVSVAHACLAQTFFCFVVVVALLTGRSSSITENSRAGIRMDGLVTALTVTTTGMVFVQLLLGAMMRHLGAGGAIPDFPLAFGRIFPPIQSAGVAVHFLHRLGALAVVLFFLSTTILVLRRHPGERRLRNPALLGLGILAIQVGLGATVVWTGLAVIPTTAHVAVGAGVLACSLVLAIRAFQITPFPISGLPEGTTG